MDLQRKQFKTEFAGKPLTLEVSRIAEFADAAVIGTYGGTTVLATAVMGGKDKDSNYFPLMVNYEEKFYAAGKILGSRFMRREGRSSDEAILSGRLIDRTIRPLFDQRIRREVQIVVTVLSVDNENDPDFIGLLSASTAIAISPIPWDGPVAGIKIVKFKDDSSAKFNPTFSEIAGNKVEFNAFVSGTKERINMIELEGDEAPEKNVVSAFTQGHKEIQKLISWQESVIKEIRKPKTKIQLANPSQELKKKIVTFLKGKLEKAVYNPNKTEMYNNMAALRESLKEFLVLEKHAEDDLKEVEAIFEEEVNALVHEKVLKEEKRPDSRKLDEVRDLHAEVAILPRVHGSALFVRGNTQSLAVTTLGGPGDQQLVETVEFSGKKRFLLHYNFPPYSVGEIGPFRGPSRRDIGHGNLAHKALNALLPTQEEFPYTIRLVSEILSSNGSSSMATVCAGSLSLMDAGVPIRKPAAGIAMGLMLDEKGNKYKILTDIQGPEDHHGDMDFKVAGTDSGVTAIQMDVKIQGITEEMLDRTLAQAKEARLHILKTIVKALPEARKELSPFAPSILSLKINPSQIGDVIGSGGKVINGIIEKTGATSIDIEDDGQVFITAPNQETGRKALEQVMAIVKEYKIGDIVEGNVVKILEFGAIVEFGGGKDGMIHVSELKEGFVKKVEDVVKIGDFVRAKIIKSENGKIGLSIKQLNK
ncbi:MAG: polyribonucleotide nucleotidyltransferase [bacterium]|nr:polyribonucleotide nucleotidyltransferase [bacterium]